MINWPLELIKDIAVRKSVLFLGSGISRNATNSRNEHPPTWEQFLRRCMQQVNGNTAFIEKLFTEKDYLTACEIIVDKVGLTKFRQIAEDCFRRPGYTAHDIHKSIFDLDSHIVATPNVDKIYDVYANQLSQGTVVVKNYYDTDLADRIRRQDPIIIKTHGTIDASSHMVFTRSEYSQARNKYWAFYQILSALVLTHTFIFLGCGLSDPDIRLILEDFACTHPESRPHFFVTSANEMNEDLAKSVQNNLNLEVITYSPEDNHKELADSLEALVKLVEDERRVVALNWLWW